MTPAEVNFRQLWAVSTNYVLFKFSVPPKFLWLLPNPALA